MLQKIIIGINILLLLCVGYLLYVHFFQTKSAKNENQENTFSGKSAFVKTDRIIEEYQYAIDLNEELTSRQEEIRTDLNIEGKKLEKMVKSFQRKLQNNGFTSRSRAERAQKRIIDKEKKLQELKDKLTKELFNKQEAMRKSLSDTIQHYLQLYNSDNNYDLILRSSQNGGVIYGKEALDISDEIINLLNDKYKKK